HELKSYDTNVINRMVMNINRRDNWQTPTNAEWSQGTLTDLTLWQAYYRAPVSTNQDWPFGTNEFPIAREWHSPAEDVLTALGRYDSVIEELRRAGELPESRYPIEYSKEDPFTILL